MKLLITDAFKCTDDQIEYLKSLGHEIVFSGDEREKIEFDVSDIDGVICNGLFLYNDIERFKSLKYIQLTSAGYDRVPMDYVKLHEIEIHNARGVYSAPMAEFALCGVLNIYKQSKFFAENQKLHKWDKHWGLLELYGKTVCIVGSGNVGTECAKRFKAFGTTIYAVDICEPKSEIYDKYFALENINLALRESDIVVLTLPLTEQTKYMFDKEVFSYFKSNAVLVNIARGGIVNQNDLIIALDSGRLFGAVLDVFETEPLQSDSPLWDMQNVIITPHNSFVGQNNNKRMFEVMISNLEENSNE